MGRDYFVKLSGKQLSLQVFLIEKPDSASLSGQRRESTDTFGQAMLQAAVGIERLRQVRDPIFRVLGRLKRGLRL